MNHHKRLITDHKRIFIYCLLFTVYCFSSCQKEIKVQLPEPRQKICVDGRIEPGMPPYVVLTRNMPYFGPSDLNALNNLFIHEAVVKVSNGTTEVQLTEFCSAALPDSMLDLISSITGVDPAVLKSFSYCLYSTFDQTIWGETGKNYSLSVSAEGKTLSSSTAILPAMPLDSAWYKYEKTNSTGDSLGFVWAHLSDPPSPGNAYRWLAMREGKDYAFIAPSGSAFDDKFINGVSFDFAYNRGQVFESTAPDDNNEEAGYFKKGDTVVVKFCTIDRAAFDFFRQMDVVIYNGGNPFAAPSSVPANISPAEDALGLWCGYGVSLDTVVFR